MERSCCWLGWGCSQEHCDLEFEVTEATLAQLIWTQNPVIPQLRELGVKIDFGSEYSSSINRSTTDPVSAATIRAIVNFARDIGIVVIAQGVETEERRDLLTLTDITTQAQGFHFSNAVEAERARCCASAASTSPAPPRARSTPCRSRRGEASAPLAVSG